MKLTPWTICALLAGAAGCAAPPGEIFPMHGKGKVWPPAPDPPRIRFLGTLAGATDLKPAVPWSERLARAARGTTPPLRLIAPYDVAVSEDDKVYVTDPETHGVFIFDLENRTTRLIDHAGAKPLERPSGLALGPKRLFVTDPGLRLVTVFDRNGTLEAFWGEDDLARPTGITHCPQTGALYVIDTAAHQCVRFDGQGRITGRFGTRGGNEGQFNFPLQVNCSPRHGLAVTDSLNFRVQRFDHDGRFLGMFGSKGDGAGDFALPKGITADAAGRLLVVDAQYENVQIFEPDGRLLLAFGHEGQGVGEFWLPAGVCVDHRNRIWVADTYNRRLQVFEYMTGAVQ